MSSSEKPEVTWGVVGEHAVFGWSSQIDDLRVLRKALETAATWGEFRERIPSGYLEDLRERADEDEEEPSDSAAFNAHDIAEYREGDWPEWLQQDMLSWMPQDVQERFGEKGHGLDGPALDIPADRGEETARAMEAHGYVCTRDDEAVRQAAGWA